MLPALLSRLRELEQPTLPDLVASSGLLAPLNRPDAYTTETWLGFPEAMQPQGGPTPPPDNRRRQTDARPWSGPPLAQRLRRVYRLRHTAVANGERTVVTVPGLHDRASRATACPRGTLERDWGSGLDRAPRWGMDNRVSDDLR
jgi:hypothetical protein